MQSSGWELRLLKALLWIYIGLCLIIASLNWGYVPSAPLQVASAITALWHFYENWFKTLLIVACSFLTLRIVQKKKVRTTMRKQNLVGFAIAALLIHIILPLLLQNPELYFFAMPLPWSTVPLQAGIEGTAMHQSLTRSIGLGGVRASLLFFWIYSACIMVGTLLFGRRLQCSTLCLFNGFASEIFGPAIPLAGRFKTPLSKRSLSFTSLARKGFFILALGFTLYWALSRTGGIGQDQATISRVETFILEEKRHRSYDMLLKLSGMPAEKTLESFDFPFQPNLNEQQIHQLAKLDFVRAKENIVFMAKPGRGNYASYRVM